MSCLIDYVIIKKKKLNMNFFYNKTDQSRVIKKILLRSLAQVF